MTPDPIEAVLFDLSGVLYEGDRPIEGARATVAEVRDRGIAVRFVTNTATRTRGTILEKLKGFGIEVEEDELVTAPDAAKAYLRERGLKAYCVVHEAIRGEFAEFEGEGAVVIGDAREGLGYAALDHAFRLVRGGAPLIAIGKNRYFRDGSGLRLDAGAFVHGLEWAAETEAVVMGKPSADFFHQVVASTDYGAHQCLMVGDDAESDVAAACSAGLQGVLVWTGKYREGDEKKLPTQARTIDSIANLSECLDR